MAGASRACDGLIEGDGVLPPPGDGTPLPEALTDADADALALAVADGVAP